MSVPCKDGCVSTLSAGLLPFLVLSLSIYRISSLCLWFSLSSLSLGLASSLFHYISRDSCNWTHESLQSISVSRGRVFIMAGFQIANESSQPE